MKTKLNMYVCTHIQTHMYRENLEKLSTRRKNIYLYMMRTKTFLFSFLLLYFHLFSMLSSLWVQIHFKHNWLFLKLTFTLSS
jgi:hypothetical protein